ncbi:ABC transporter permease [Rossellomorea sp. BNER]|uniref:ABC transporter permease n=1 Tax=Rossellomorea sp. BNER TaxID=2962031 RepID=UPI003AF2DFA8|nr:ABC transporter permease [Rossellomorea sp. BNER]
MKLKDQFRFIRKNMKKNRSRVFMTILATSIGCAFLIVLASVGFGLHKHIISEITQDRSVTQIEIHGKEQGSGDSSITDKDIKRFEEIPNVKAVTRRKNVDALTQVELGNYLAQTSLSVVHYPSEKKAGFELKEGRMPEKPNEVIVGYHFKEGLYKSIDEEPSPEEIYNEKGQIKKELRYSNKESLLNQTLLLKTFKSEGNMEVPEETSLKIVGIAKAPKKDWLMDGGIFISDTVLQKINKFASGEKNPTTNQEYQQVTIYANSMEEVKDISQSLKDEGYYVYSVVDEIEEVNLVFSILKFGLVFIGTIALLIASIGIYNTMSMAVTERTQDIGIMKAIGGHPKIIKKIFLLESSYIGLIGAILGALVAYLISFSVNAALPFAIKQFFEQEMTRPISLSYIPPYLTITCIILSILVAVLSGLKPASKATKIDVLSALRRDI